MICIILNDDNEQYLPETNSSTLANISQAEIDQQFTRQLSKNLNLHYVRFSGSAVDTSTTLKQEKIQTNDCHPEQIPSPTTSTRSLKTSCATHTTYSVSKPSLNNIITINLDTHHKKTGLILHSVQPVKWVIQGDSSVLQMIYLMGNPDSRLAISYKPSNIYIFSNITTNTNACLQCTFLNLPDMKEHHEEFSDITNYVVRYFGKQPASIQIDAKARAFAIN